MAMSLIPVSMFLAKNEDPNHRRPPIKLWKLDQNNPLCPVSALQRYLAITDSIQEDALFLHPQTSSPLSIRGLTKRMVTLIREANPDSFPHVHDIRKYATTLAFLGGATLDDLSRYTGWRSIRVFWRHYKKSVEDLTFTVQAAGSVVAGPPSL